MTGALVALSVPLVGVRASEMPNGHGDHDPPGDGDGDGLDPDDLPGEVD